jgi:tetratricopeptide (TPR) repeat protein
MTTNRPLSLFISSKMQELAEERRAVQTALKAYEIPSWLWEDDAGARPERIRTTYLTEVEECDIYLGLFWLDYGPYTIEEFEHARQLHKPCLIYEKYVNAEQRSPELAAFLHRLQEVENPESLPVSRFETSDQLARQVQSDVMRLLTTRFRESRQQPSTRLWIVPYQRNPLFTGRKDILENIHEAFRAGETTVLTQAISGLGGIGKTQIAIEYAYHYYDEYPIILWATADTRDTLITDILTIADFLHLPESKEKDQEIIVEAVKRWLANQTNWLFIMDNADNLDLAYKFIPPGTNVNGNILLTTRSYATGNIAHSIQVEKMALEEGLLLILRRAKILTPNALLDQAIEVDRIQAKSIVDALDGLPLAIDQAGAYIEETGCGLAGYLGLYQTQRSKLLKERGNLASDHPESVTTTIALTFQKIQETDSSAADLLRLCAFLHPEAIPEEVFTDYVPKLDPTLQPIVANQFELDSAIRSLLKFSLVQRDTNTKTLTIHRLVQAVLKDEVDEHLQREWAESAVRSVSRSFPFAHPETWQKCQSFLPHAYVCAELIEQWHIESIEAAGLSYRMGEYLYARALYQEAEFYYKKASMITEKVNGPEYPGLATILSSLGRLYFHQAKYAQAETLYQQALKIRKNGLGQESLEVASSFYDLASLYSAQSKYTRAQSLYSRALEIRKKLLGSMHPEVGSIFNNLALNYTYQGNFAEAERLFRQSLGIKEQGPENINLSSTLNNLANVYRILGKYTEAEEMSKRALAICEKIRGSDHPDVATRCNNLALIYYDQGKYPEAETLYMQALEISEKTYGPNHPDVATALENVAALYSAQGKHIQTESLFKRALEIKKQTLGPTHPKVADSHNLLAQYYFHRHKNDQAESHYRQALAIYEQTLGSESSNLIPVLRRYAALLRTVRREAEAIILETRARNIAAKKFTGNRRPGKKGRKSALPPKGKSSGKRRTKKAQ